MAGSGKQTHSPKAIIHQKFGAKASYRVEEVHDSSLSSCPGLAIPQKGPSLYRCHLQLPDFSVVSNVFKKKKDSEQAAAELALEKLGIRPQKDDLTVDEAKDDIVARIKYIFSDEFLSADHPLGAHLRAALRRDGDCCGSVPASVIATFDAKINSRCKIINPSVESDPFLVISYVMEAAAKLSDYIVASPHIASLRRKIPYPSEIVEALPTHVFDSVDSRNIKAVYIPCLGKEIVEPDALDSSSDQYYLDIIAERFGLKDGNQVMISRTFGKASCGSECRLYSAIPNKLKFSDYSPAVSERLNLESRNARASYICGQDIHGDAILASVGYRWKSDNLDYDDVTVKSFYRICCGMSPNGIYKISRKAVLAAQLPISFTTKSNWGIPLPREILCTFCHQHRLAEPIFSLSASTVKSLYEIYRSHKKLKVSGSADTDDDNLSKEKEDTPGLGHGFRCEVKILTKSQDLVLDCSPRKFYEKENDAIQNASLKALLWFSKFFDDLDVDGSDSDDEEDIKSPSTNVFAAPPIHGNGDSSRTKNVPSEEKPVQTITNGSVVRICYSLSLAVDPAYSSDDYWSDRESEEEPECYMFEEEPPAKTLKEVNRRISLLQRLAKWQHKKLKALTTSVRELTDSVNRMKSQIKSPPPREVSESNEDIESEVEAEYSIDLIESNEEPECYMFEEEPPAKTLKEANRRINLLLRLAKWQHKTMKALTTSVRELTDSVKGMKSQIKSPQGKNRSPPPREVSESNEDIESEVEAEYSIDLIESNEEIEFEVGIGAMNSHIESAVTQMTVGEYASFNTTLPAAAEALILAVANDTERMRHLLSERSHLDYSIVLLGVKGPTEERMEAAFFKPPLSKQRVEYALKHIKESSASTLVDFGCGSGSLLNSLLDYQTSLQTIIGVDISLKGLTRAANMLHSKLNKEAWNVESATLYDGSILEFDSRLYNIDIGTCLEVIEHMEEDEACEFGEKVLSLFRPKLLIVSTPNYEFNTILQRSTQEEDKSDESQLPKFRNNDHKFEWTRVQFNEWAAKLAQLHNYSVEFSGVGGSGEVEPGFASQIAVFRREASSEDKVVEERSMQQPYNVIWEWKKGVGEKKD